MARKADAVNINIRKHEEEVVVNWKHSERARELYKFFDLFNRRFFAGKLPTPAISFRPGRVTTLGWYRIGRNEFGVKDQINLNTLHLERPKYLSLVTLLHEMVHQWQDYFGKHGARYYHNKQFQAKSRELGIPSDSKGYTLSITDPFIEFCRRHGVDFQERSIGGLYIIQRRRGKSKLKKYNCGCTNIWAATKVRANCRLCGGEFEPRL